MDNKLCNPCELQQKESPLDYINPKKVYKTKQIECLIPLLKSMTSSKYCDIPPAGCK